MTLLPLPAPLVTRVEVVTPSGRPQISRDSLAVCQCRFPEQDGYRVREVRGYDTRDGFFYDNSNAA